MCFYQLRKILLVAISDLLLHLLQKYRHHTYKQIVLHLPTINRIILANDGRYENNWNSCWQIFICTKLTSITIKSYVIIFTAPHLLHVVSVVIYFCCRNHCYCNIVRSVTITFINSFDAITFVHIVLNLCSKRYWWMARSTIEELKKVLGSDGKKRTMLYGKISLPNYMKRVLNFS